MLMNVNKVVFVRTAAVLTNLETLDVSVTVDSVPALMAKPV